MEFKSYNKGITRGAIFRFSGLIFIAILILKNPFTECSNPDRPFYNTVLSDFDSGSYFIALKIKTSSYKGRAIIENNNLYNFLNKAKGLDKESYKSFMKSTLVHHRALRISDKDLIFWHFKKVVMSESVIKNANHGRDNFVAHYFNGIMLIYDVPEEEENAIIDQLFYWEYPARIDKSTGKLIIG